MTSNKKFYFALSLLLLSFILCGCNKKKDYTLYFKEELIINYNSDDSPLSLIEKIGDIEVTEDMIKDNKITIDHFEVTSSAIDSSVLGSHEAIFETNSTKSEEMKISKTVIVRDIEAPTITLLESTFTMTLEEYQEFVLNDYFNVTDNDELDPIVTIELDEEITIAGEYLFVIRAEDRKGNVSTAQITIIIEVSEEAVKNDEAILSDEENESSNHSNDSSTTSDNSNDTSSSNQSGGDSSSNGNASTTTKPPSKKFLFTDGYTIATVESACVNYLLEYPDYAGYCIAIRDENNILLGAEAHFR